MKKELKILWISRYDYRKGIKVELHKHDFYQMIYILEGFGELVLEDKNLSIKAKQLYTIHPGQLHSIVPSQDKELKTFDIKFNINDDELRQVLLELNSEITVVDHATVNLFENILNEGQKKEAMFDELSSIYLAQLIYLHYRQEKSQTMKVVIAKEDDSKEKDLADAVRDYISHKYNELNSVKGIAEHLGYSESYLRHIFKQKYNSTILQYLYSYRIEKSQDLIQNSEYSLKVIAEKVGFLSIHHFSRVFKAQVGLTPGQYRNYYKIGLQKDIYFSSPFTNSDHTVALNGDE